MTWAGHRALDNPRRAGLTAQQLASALVDGTVAPAPRPLPSGATDPVTGQYQTIVCVDRGDGTPVDGRPEATPVPVCAPPL